MSVLARAGMRLSECQTTRLRTQRYLVYLNKGDSERRGLTTNDLSDQKTAPLTPKSFIYNQYPFSQAGDAGSSPVSRSIESIVRTGHMGESSFLAGGGVPNQTLPSRSS